MKLRLYILFTALLLAVLAFAAPPAGAARITHQEARASAERWGDWLHNDRVIVGYRVARCWRKQRGARCDLRIDIGRNVVLILEDEETGEETEVLGRPRCTIRLYVRPRSSRRFDRQTERRYRRWVVGPNGDNCD